MLLHARASQRALMVHKSARLHQRPRHKFLEREHDRNRHVPQLLTHMELDELFLLAEECDFFRSRHFDASAPGASVLFPLVIVRAPHSLIFIFQQVVFTT